MPWSLIVRAKRKPSFAAVLSQTSSVLSELLNLNAVPRLEAELPPARMGSTLDGKLIDRDFPGAYVRLVGIERSMASFLVFDSPVQGSGERLLLSCGADGRSAASDVLAASLAISASQLVEGVIDDAAHYWLAKDEYDPEELLKHLRLEEDQRGFTTAVEIVRSRMAQASEHA